MVLMSRATATTTPVTNLCSAVLVVTDAGTLRSRDIVMRSVGSGYNVVVVGRQAHDVADYMNAALHEQVWTFVADLADPEQVSHIIERAIDIAGPLMMIIDPGGLLADVEAADRRVA